MSIKKPIFYSYDLCKKTAVDLLAIIHVDDRNTEVLEVAVTQGGEAVSMTGKTVIARFVSAKDHILFSDNVACSVNEAGNILVPFDNAVIQSRKCDLKIEVKIADGTDVLTLQFPLWVRVNGSILDTAEISPESQGTIPELLRSVLEELERVGEYVDENALFDAIDTAFTGGGTLVPTANWFWAPGENPYSIPPNGDVVKSFKKYGWGWGGEWRSKRDYMHFSYFHT